MLQTAKETILEVPNVLPWGKGFQRQVLPLHIEKDRIHLPDVPKLGPLQNQIYKDPMFQNPNFGLQRWNPP
jgi:hypothetical protein